MNALGTESVPPSHQPSEPSAFDDEEEEEPLRWVKEEMSETPAAGVGKTEVFGG